MGLFDFFKKKDLELEGLDLREYDSALSEVYNHMKNFDHNSAHPEASEDEQRKERDKRKRIVEQLIKKPKTNSLWAGIEDDIPF